MSNAVLLGMAVSVRKILVPVDFSPCSKAALELAIAFQRRFGAELEILTVWQPPMFGSADNVYVVGREELTLAQYLGRQAEEAMQALQSELRQREMGEFHCIVERGEPYKVIVKVAQDFDLVVMGTHGRSGFQRLMLGSVAERVIRRATAPVLTVNVHEGSP